MLFFFICGLVIGVEGMIQNVPAKQRRKQGREGGCGPGGAIAPPLFGRTVNPISTRGRRLCPPQYFLKKVTKAPEKHYSFTTDVSK